MSSMSVIPSNAVQPNYHTSVAGTALTLISARTPANGETEFQPETDEPQQEGEPSESGKAFRLKQLHLQYEFVERNEDFLAQSQEVKRTLAAQYYRLGKMLILELAFKPRGATDRQHFERMGFNWTRCQKAMLIAEEFDTAEAVNGMTVSSALKIAKGRRRSRTATAKRKKKGGYAANVQSPSSRQHPIDEEDEWGLTLEEEIESEWNFFKDKIILLIGVNGLQDFLQMKLADLELLL
jgi:hypothetical protein